jgi:hypothetical protein
MNAYDLADIIEDDMEDGFGMGFLKDAVSMIRQQADRIAELEKQLDIHFKNGFEAGKLEGWKAHKYHSTPQTKPAHDFNTLTLDTGEKRSLKPLSDEEILEMTIWNKNLYELYVEMEKEDMIAFARSIEKAHGIK